MRKRAWIKQLKRQVEKYGEDEASWHVFWNDPDGGQRSKSCGGGSKGLLAAEKMADRIHAELLTGTYRAVNRQAWEKFWSDYETKILEGMEPRSQEAARQSLQHFIRIIKPKRLDSIKSDTIDDFISKRRKELGRLDKSAGPKPERVPVSPATINKDLRYVRAMLRIAHEWGDVKQVPKFRFLKQPKKLPTFVSPEHFAAIYQACDQAKFPHNLPNVSAGDWWRALLTLAILTGWRISQILALKWSDIDLELGTAASMAEDNKGNRDVKIPLHPVVIGQLKKLAGSFDAHVFPWNHGRSMVWTQFRRIQDVAEIDKGKPLPKGGKGGNHYGFHDLRRGFATANAENIDLFRLQALMQHKSLETTRGYVNLAKSLRQSVDGLHVPEVLRAARS